MATRRSSSQLLGAAMLLLAAAIVASQAFVSHSPARRTVLSDDALAAAAVTGAALPLLTPEPAVAAYNFFGVEMFESFPIFCIFLLLGPLPPFLQKFSWKAEMERCDEFERQKSEFKQWEEQERLRLEAGQNSDAPALPEESKANKKKNKTSEAIDS
eukprot:TRINITY_DN102656_c0_g1_i1.p1 TRINITY_DN102656_c0_g1~~TRINITY_DN102656_c0_g1_i1.p1  ORF type:complete len:157 (-),score=40.03 TRINITY_DN102656_c0_g1_i1:208-678(-)